MKQHWIHDELALSLFLPTLVPFIAIGQMFNLVPLLAEHLVNKILKIAIKLRFIHNLMHHTLNKTCLSPFKSNAQYFEQKN